MKVNLKGCNPNCCEDDIPPSFAHGVHGKIQDSLKIDCDLRS